MARGRDFYKKRHWENSTMPEDDVFDDSSNQSFRVFGNNTSCSEESTTPDVHRSSSICSKTVQKSLARFIVPEDKADPTPIDKIQSDINRILIVLNSLTVTEKNRPQGTEFGVNSNVTTSIIASNLLEIRHPDIVIDIIEDGCKVTCVTCKNFIMSQPEKRM